MNRLLAIVILVHSARDTDRLELSPYPVFFFFFFFWQWCIDINTLSYTSTSSIVLNVREPLDFLRYVPHPS